MSTGHPGDTITDVEELIPPLDAVMVAIPVIPGVKSPSASIEPELEIQLICSLIGLPEESFTVAENWIT